MAALQLRHQSVRASAIQRAGLADGGGALAQRLSVFAQDPISALEPVRIGLAVFREHGDRRLIGLRVGFFLGAEAGSLALPDFPKLGIELKTIPLSRAGKPLESTYVSIVPLVNTVGIEWSQSVVWHKLRHVLWIPIIGDRETPIGERIIGNALLWQPSATQTVILKNDWEEHMEKISLGYIDQIKSGDGMYLQIRPKAANNRALSNAVGEDGSLIQTLPRGFYLRARFTREIMEAEYV